MTFEASPWPGSRPVDRLVGRLSSEDLDILSLENETVAGHTCKVIVLDGEIDPDRLTASIASRLDRGPELRLRLQSVDGDPWWGSAATVDLDRHVVVHEGGGRLDDAGLRAKVARLFEQRLDRSEPLWRMDVLPELSDGRSAVIWRMHHALADGTTFMRLASAVLWDQEVDRVRSTGPPSERSPTSSRSTESQRSRPIRTFVRETPRPWSRSPFDGHIGAQRSVAFATARLDGLHRAAAACEGATVNDAVLAAVAGGLRRWLEAGHGHLGVVRVKVPVSLHGMPAHRGDDGRQPGNRDSFFCVDLPLGATNPLDRLETIRRATRSRKDGHDAERLDALMRDLGRASPRLRQFAERALAHPRSFALNVSNVKGPRRPVHVLRLPVRSFHSVAEIRERHALRVAVMSLADTISFGLCADPTLIPDVDKLAEFMQVEATVLADCELPQRA
jgi:diacylglycerol O-acyltransferase / wax synthase